MKKSFEKIFVLASVVVAIILIMVLVVTAFGGIKQEDFDNNLVRGLLFTLAILYLVLSVVAVVLVFINSDVIKEVTLRSEQGGSVKVSVHVIAKYVKNACAEVEGVKCKKVTLVSDEYGVRLKADVKVVDKDVIEVETYLRTLLEDMFLNEFNFKFNSIEFKVTALVPKYKADKEEIDAAVLKKLEEIKAEKHEEDAVSEEVEAANEEAANEEAVEEAEDAEVAEDVEAVEEPQEEPALEEQPVQEVELAEEPVEEAEAEEAPQEEESEEKPSEEI
ncbi:MAG: hypothetical protein J5713_00625 [Clostridia bacterium]|nr:hypothetical protein [Clostridia bacterium]